MNSAEKWIAETCGDKSVSQIAREAGIPQPTLNRQIIADALTIENLVKIARQYAASIPDALISQGIVTAEEMAQVSARGTLAELTDAQLLDELARRLEDRGAENETEATVHHVDFGAVDDERAAASERGADDPNDDDANWQ